MTVQLEKKTYTLNDIKPGEHFKFVDTRTPEVADYIKRSLPNGMSTEYLKHGVFVYLQNQYEGFMCVNILNGVMLDYTFFKYDNDSSECIEPIDPVNIKVVVE